MHEDPRLSVITLRRDLDNETIRAKFDRNLTWIILLIAAAFVIWKMNQIEELVRFAAVM